MAALTPLQQANLQKIENFVVLMFENRSFDHLAGYLRTVNPAVEGPRGTEFNLLDPNNPASQKFTVSTGAPFSMPFDPDHEFDYVNLQLYGSLSETAPTPLMNGFVESATNGGTPPAVASLAMKCFAPEQLRVFSALCREFALFNFWFSSLPGPTWPNRFFVHAATSGGLCVSPNTGGVISGFSFSTGTIYDRLSAANIDWRIYHNGLPQTAGIDSLRDEFIDPFTDKFSGMDKFDDDVDNNNLPPYTFIEPSYDTGNNYRDGDSMHPLNDIRKGEMLLKQVYEKLRGSAYWEKLMLIIMFDEHGGFYDHIPPPAAVPPGDDNRYKTIFNFDRLGVRVPAIVISPYTVRGTVIGTDPNDPSTLFDHTSTLATVEKRFVLAPLTKRDAAANTVAVALNADTPRLKESEAVMILPIPAPNPVPGKAMSFADVKKTDLSKNQNTMLDLALSVDLKTSDPANHAAIRTRHDNISNENDANAYIKEIESKVISNRKMSKK